MVKTVPSLDRRTFVLGSTATAVLLSLLHRDAAAQVASQPWEDAVKKILGDNKPTDGRLSFELPEIAENGNTVPFTVTVESPMTEQDHVKALHLLSTGNPQPGIATFRFTPLSGRASTSSRLRLAKTQDVIGIAELSDGKFLMARRSVKVTIGGCGG
jgi:sulfur-oxidizing protein SoxY